MKNLFSPVYLLTLLLTLTRAGAQEATPSPTAPVVEPPTSWVDPDTGHRVVRLTREADSASLYFNYNGYTPDGRQMIYTTPEGIGAVDLKTFKTRIVVPGPVRAIVVGRKTPSVFYIKREERALYSTHLDTGETRKLGDLPPRGNIATINADETLAAGTYIEGEGADYGGTRAQQGRGLEQPQNKGQMMEERLAARHPMAMYTLDLRNGKTTPVLRSTDWLGHVQFSPTDPTLLLYCHEGPWHKVDRVWTIRTDGSQKTLVHRRTMAMEIAGHEFWSADGKTVWYDLQTPKGEVFYLAGYHTETGERTWNHLQRDEWSIHFNISNDGTLFCGDGGDPGQVAKAPDGRWIYLFRPQLTRFDAEFNKGLIRPGVLRSERLVNMAKHGYKLEPNVSFTPDQKWVVFRSNMFGPTYTFAVEVEKAAPEPGR
ncbi:MAG TPA: oligogalacturonate lyase family protein [Chthoniobacteraceae bacterium]|jgi:oligogalacturonide lyase